MKWAMIMLVVLLTASVLANISLAASHDEVSRAYSELGRDYSELAHAYDELGREYDELGRECGELNQACDWLNQECNELMLDYLDQQWYITQLEAGIAVLEALLGIDHQEDYGLGSL